jgi:hypothetical protein
MVKLRKHLGLASAGLSSDGGDSDAAPAALPVTLARAPATLAPALAASSGQPAASPFIAPKLDMASLAEGAFGGLQPPPPTISPVPAATHNLPAGDARIGSIFETRGGRGGGGAPKPTAPATATEAPAEDAPAGYEDVSNALLNFEDSVPMARMTNLFDQNLRAWQTEVRRAGAKGAGQLAVLAKKLRGLRTGHFGSRSGLQQWPARCFAVHRYEARHGFARERRLRRAAAAADDDLACARGHAQPAGRRRAHRKHL